MRDLKDNPLSPQEEEILASCGAVGFTWKQVAIIFDLEQSEVRAQFMEERGQVYEVWLRGRLQKELEVRQAVLQSALNGSSPSQLQLMNFYNEADAEHLDLKSF